jgi:hypothetical protein
MTKTKSWRNRLSWPWKLLAREEGLMPPYYFEDKPVQGCPTCGNKKTGVFRTTDNRMVRGPEHKYVAFVRTRICKNKGCEQEPWKTYELNAEKVAEVFDKAGFHEANLFKEASL